MIDRKAIYARFASCYGESTPARLARRLGVVNQTVYDWESGKTMISKVRLKKLVDEESLHWDWLIEGKEPMRRRREAGELCKPLDRHGVNQRLLSLFPDMSEAKLAVLLGVHQTAVHKWRHDRAFVSWGALEFAVTEKEVAWDWLFEGWK